MSSPNPTMSSNNGIAVCLRGLRCTPRGRRLNCFVERTASASLDRLCRVRDTVRAVIPVAVVTLLSVSAAAQGSFESYAPLSIAGAAVGLTMMRVVPYAEESSPPGAATVAPYSCYRVGRCSADDLYRFRDRPNRLARLAPEAPPENIALPPSVQYMWTFVPITPEENITSKYRTASQVRDAYRTVGRPIEGPN